MKVLMLNGSARKGGNTHRVLLEIGKQLEKEGISYEIFQIDSTPVRDCNACGKCTDRGCIYEDDSVNDFIARAKQADGFVFGMPVYYAHPGGHVLSFLNRVFYSSSAVFSFKPGVSVTVARKGGTSTNFDVLNKYFGISRMPVAGSIYWDQAHSHVPEESASGAEGMQTMRNLARNLAWMMKCFQAGEKAGVPLPVMEKDSVTNFSR
ncbi:MAG: flavodoxin family protein [Clostridiales bacterium]|nr:flavodoxin family protein [Clostridiales bacterium]